MKKKPDLTIILISVILIMIGTVMVFSASSPTCAMLSEYHNDPYYYLKRQLINIAFGTVGFLIFAFINIKEMKKYGHILFLCNLLLLGLILIPGVGISSKGATRWLGVGSFSFQPAEFAKLFCIIFIATYLSKRGENIQLPKQFFIITAWIVGTAFLIQLEPDLGTALSICFVFVIMLYIGGANKLHLTSLVGLGGGLVTAILLFGGHSYRIKRLTSFLDPWKDAQNTGYHVCQSLIAIGSGGFGLGLGESRQKFLYLPEQHTDFIFAIIGEELGIVGTIVIVLLFCFLLHRGLKIASETSDLFLSLLARGCTLMITLQAFMNIGVVVGILPCTGIPLPFISYGGSSLIATMMMAGILFNISQYCSREGIGLHLEDENSSQDYDYSECLDAEEN